MIVESVEAIAIRAELPGQQTYWGARTWSSDRGMAISTYPPEARRRYIYSPTIDTVVVKVQASDGTVGWGECKAPVGAPVTASIVNTLLAPLVTGSSLADIVVTWERMYAAMRVRGHDSGFWVEALSGVDIALWDAWARHLDKPIWSLLGGAFRTEVPVYASGIPASPGTDGAKSVRQEAERLVELGYRQIKVAIGVDPVTDITSVAEVKRAVGESGQVYADAAGQYDAAQALQVGRQLQELGVGFFEMPIPPEDVSGYGALAAKLDIPLALDSITERHKALQFLRCGGLHVLQPDVCRAGGITEVMRIATIADAFGCIATPHISIGSAIHFAASLQCAAAIPNLAVMEHWIGNNPIGRPIAPDLEEPVSGRRTLPAGPGLGIEIDEDAVRSLAW